MKKIWNYFTTAEKLLWGTSVLCIVASFCIFDGKNYLTLVASLVGVTSLVFNAKGNPAGQALMIVFSILYGVISYSFDYYGEMATYLGMTLPMAVISLIAWLKNPFDKSQCEVRVNRISAKEQALMWTLSVAVTVAFYFVLDYFDTANIVPSTVSVTTSFVAVYLTFRRSPYFALAYAANDIVLLLLWTLATIENTEYASVIVCFASFLVNDLYGFVSWKKMEKRQNKTLAEQTMPDKVG